MGCADQLDLSGFRLCLSLDVCFEPIAEVLISCCVRAQRKYCRIGIGIVLGVAPRRENRSFTYCTALMRWLGIKVGGEVGLGGFWDNARCFNAAVEEN